MIKNVIPVIFFRDVKLRPFLKKITLLLIVCGLCIPLYAQQDNPVISVELTNATLRDFFDEIETHTPYSVVYRDLILSVQKDVTVKASGELLTKVLEKVLPPKGLSYQLSNKTIVIITAEQVQQKPSVTVSGVITDDSGEPVIGANVTIKGTTTGTITDMDGHFTLNASPDDILVVSYIGYLNENISIGNKTLFDIVLREDAQAIDEIVVVGYGTQRKGSVTGSVASVETKDIVKAPVSDVTNALAGRLPGLRVVTTSGEPGWNESSIDIRGFGDALIVVDGVPGSFSQLDSHEIESISVLKDASAAVYGVKAANGVILVTTKRGKVGKTRINFNSTFSWQRPTVFPRSVNAADFVELTDEDKINRGLEPLYGPDEARKWREGGPGYESTDWYDMIVRNYAPQQQYNLNVSGGNEGLKYYASLGIMDTEGMWKTGSNNFQRYNFLTNVDAQVTKRLSTSIKVAARKENRNSPKTSAANITSSLYRNYPTYKPFANDNPDYFGETNVPHMNPLALIDDEVVGYYKGEKNTFDGTAEIKYDASQILQGLSGRVSYSYRYQSDATTDFVKKYNIYRYDEAANSYNVSYVGNEPSNLTKKQDTKNYSLFQAALNYENAFGKHFVSGLLLFEATQADNNWFNAYREYVIDSLDELNAGVDKNKNNEGTSTEESNMGYVGRINYAYDNRYLFEFSFRYDGSSLFPSDSRWGFFPAFNIGWRPTQEGFFDGKTDVLNDLKIRATWGRLGDDSQYDDDGNKIIAYQFLSGYTYPDGNYMFGDDVLLTMKSRGLANPNITWYTSDLYNVGVDFTLWHGLLAGEVDVFYRKRNGLLATRSTSLPGTFGAALPKENLNSDSDRGFEIVLKHFNQLDNGLDYSIRGNVSYTHSKHNYVERNPSTDLYTDWRNNTNDRWKNIYWGYKAVGQFQSYDEIANSPVQDGNGNQTLRPGDIKYLDYNGDGVIDDNDQHVIGRGDKPEFMFGLDMQVNYKNFDFSLFLQGAANFNAYYSEELQNPFFNGASALEAFTDRWHRKDLYDPNSEWIAGKYPSTYAGGSESNRKKSSFWLQNASYLRIKDVQLGYTLPRHLLTRVGIEGFRVFVSGFNLATFTSLDMMDPETPSGRGQNYPPQKVISFGFNLTL